jgi:nicotinate-nucleotide adenylyltransferase
MTETVERVGILGGTFNPIHLGHLRAAEEIREHFSLATVFFVPSRTPPHKEHTALASSRQRLEMVQLALEGNPSFAVSDFELTQEQTSYSIFTIEHFRERYGDDRELYFLMGMDSFLEITTWKDYNRLFSLTNIVVVSRPGFQEQDPADVLPVDAADNFDYNPIQRVFTHVSGHRLFMHRTSLLEISSSEIRSRIEKDLSVRYLVPEAVLRYVSDHGLYHR